MFRVGFFKSITLIKIKDHSWIRLLSEYSVHFIIRNQISLFHTGSLQISLYSRLKRSPETLSPHQIPGTCECDLIGNRGLCSWNEAKMARSSWLMPMALEPMRSILMRDNRRKGDNTPKKAETGAVEPQATECQQPREAGGGEEQILPLSFQSQPFGARPFQNSKGTNVPCF